MKPKQILMTVLMLLAAFAVMRALVASREEKGRRPASPVEVVANTRVIHKQDLASRVTAWGRVRTVADIQLLSQVEGTVLSGEKAFLPGTRFAKGDLLLKVDDRPVVLKLQSARSDLLNSLSRALPEIAFDAPEDRAALEHWLEEFTLDRPLKPLPPASTHGERLLSQAGVIRLWNTARDLEIQLERHEIRAPFGGTVVSADLRPGATARAGTVIGRLQNLDDLEVEVQVAGSDIHLVGPGAVARVSLPGSGETVNGRITRISRRIDESTRTLPVYIRLEGGSESLAEGAFVQALITGSTLADAVRIPAFTLGQGNRVGLLAGGVLERREVAVLHTEGDSLVVGSGLAEGDSLVLELLQGVADGTRLRDAAAPAAAPDGGKR